LSGYTKCEGDNQNYHIDAHTLNANHIRDLRQRDTIDVCGKGCALEVIKNRGS
jgi:hypothetical protein